MTKNTPRCSKVAKKAKSRTPAKSRRNQNEFKNFTFYTGDSGLLSFTSIAARVRSSSSLKQVLQALDMTMEELGLRIGVTPEFKTQRPQGFSKTYISLIDRRQKPLTQRMLKAIEYVLSKTLSDMAGEIIGVEATLNSPWHFRLSKVCAEHGPYELKGNRRHCPICHQG